MKASHSGTKAPSNGGRLGRPPLAPDQENAIVNVASQLFAQKGYEATTLNNVCDALGLSKAAIYHYFPSKSALYDRVILNTLKKMARYLENSIDHELEATSKLKALIVNQCAFLETDVFGLTVVFESTKMMNRDMRPEAMEFMHGYETLVDSIIRKGVEDGSFAPVDVEIARRTIIGMLSWMAKWFEPGGPVSALSIADEFWHILTHGLIPR